MMSVVAQVDCCGTSGTRFIEVATYGQNWGTTLSIAASTKRKSLTGSWTPTLLNMGAVSIVGVPSSSGSYAAGQDQAPTVLRSAGLVDALSESGLEVHDEGDLPLQIWRPDRLNPRAQNLAQVTESIRELIERLIPLLARGDTLLVLGGNCTVALGVVAALCRISADPVGVLYVDRNYDINTPESTTDGALDWMGMAHALSLPGSLDVLVDVLGPRPLLEPNQVAWVGIDDRFATEWERTEARRLGLHVISSDAFAHDPVSSAVDSLERLPNGPLAVHLDVDVLDFIAAPLAENTDGRNSGPTLDQVAVALRIAAQDPRFRSLSIGELNPTRSAGDPDAIPRFVASVASVIGGMQR
jgi:arginase